MFKLAVGVHFPVEGLYSSALEIMLEIIRCDEIAVLAAGSKDLSIVQQGCREKFADRLHAPRKPENTGRWVVQLCTRQVIRRDAACNPNLAIRQSGRAGSLPPSFI
jgi:hypothetical protein